jgi:hypothetical protein
VSREGRWRLPAGVGPDPRPRHVVVLLPPTKRPSAVVERSA